MFDLPTLHLRGFLGSAGLLALAFVAIARAADPPATPEARALGFLVKEVPRWSRENHCYSCHNNGDAARALYEAQRLGVPLPPEALADTNRWLTDPDRWDHNGGEGPFSDKRLARLQFTFSLAAAAATGRVNDHGVLAARGVPLAADQGGDGAFLLEGGDSLGSPATYGRSLATLILRDTLRAAGRQQFQAAIDKAQSWLVASRVESLVDVAAVLPVVAESLSAELPGAADQRRRCIELIAGGQSTDGGWGPYASSPSEPFDTAVVMLAIVRFRASPCAAQAPDLQDRLARGRAFLVACQDPDGAWPESTRPAGGVSYAQRLSTAGWATLALLATTELGRLPARGTDPKR